MIIFAGVITFILAFTAIYCAVQSNAAWFKYFVAGVVSFVIAILVSSNFMM
jgi:hypothetical protein